MLFYKLRQLKDRMPHKTYLLKQKNVLLCAKKLILQRISQRALQSDVMADLDKITINRSVIDPVIAVYCRLHCVSLIAQAPPNS